MVKWNNVDLATKGIIVENVPAIIKGKKKIDTYTIEGRSGFIAIDNGTYEPILLSLNCHFATINSIDDIKALLDGYGTLTLDNERQYYGIVQNQIDFEKVAQAHFRKFIIQFYLDPISESIADYTATISSSTTLNITDATATMYPTLTIKGNGNVSITFNNKTFYLTDLDSTKTYTLDCKKKVIVDNNGANCSANMLYDFPELKAGTNNISYTGTISTFTATYKKAYI